MRSVDTADDAELQSVMDIASGFWRARALLSAVELELFTYLAAEGPASRDETCRDLGLDNAAAGDHLDALAALGLLSRDGARYVNSPAAERYLVRGKDTYVGGFLAFMGQALYPAWSHLTALLRSGGRQQGAESFADWYQDLDQVRGFMDAMDSASAPVAQQLIRRFDWSAREHVVDLGGARGSLLAHLARAYPALRGTCFDVPPLKPLFDEHMARLGTAGRIAFQGGDFRADPLPEGDVLVFGHVLHDWDEDTRAQLIQRAFDALRPGGDLLIYEELLDDDRGGPPRSLLMSLNMRLVRTGGGEYTAAQCRAWLAEAGFTEISVEPLTATERLIVARKP